MNLILSRIVVKSHVIKNTDLLYEKDGVLNILIIDSNYSQNYLTGKIRLYSQVALDTALMVNFLVFTEARRNLMTKLANKNGLKSIIIKGNWKY